MLVTSQDTLKNGTETLDDVRNHFWCEMSLIIHYLSFLLLYKSLQV